MDIKIIAGNMNREQSPDTGIKFSNYLLCKAVWQLMYFDLCQQKEMQIEN